jgi:Uma2 family endonuclease
MSPDENMTTFARRQILYRQRRAVVILTFPRQKIVEVYHPNAPTEMLTVEDTLEGFDVLPGFALPIVSLFVKKRSGA